MGLQHQPANTAIWEEVSSQDNIVFVTPLCKQYIYIRSSYYSRIDQPSYIFMGPMHPGRSRGCAGDNEFYIGSC